MTTAGGGSNMDIGDDYVATRLSIDVPTEGIQNLRELTEGIDRFRTALEAAARADADMTRYIDQMAEASKRAAETQANLNQHLSVFASMQARAQGGGGGVAGVPYGTAQAPFAGMTAGTGATPTPPGSRMPSPSDVVYQLNNAATRTPREYLNMQAARGGVPQGMTIAPESISALADKIAEREHVAGQQASRTGGGGPPKTPPPHRGGATDPFDQFQQRTSAATGLASSVMNEIGGSQGLPFGQLALQGVNYARKRMMDRSSKSAASSSGEGDPAAGDPEGGGGSDSGDPSGIGGGLKAAGFAGGALTAVLGAFGLIQKGGAMVQGWRDIAGQRGGSAGEGFQLSMGARQLAMDPTISTDQARQIKQALLSEGYANASGEGADNIQDLMVKAIKDWGMSVPEFVQATKALGRFSLMGADAFGGYMAEIKELSKTGYQSQQDIRREVVGNANQMIAQGVSPNMAYQQSIGASQLFADDPLLAGGISASTTTQTGFFERLYGGPGGTPADVPAGLNPALIGQWLQENGKGVEAKTNSLMKIAKQAQMAMGDHTKDPAKGSPEMAKRMNAQYMFFQLGQKMAGPGDTDLQDFEHAKGLYDKLVWGGQSAEQIVQDTKKRTDEATKSQRETGSRPQGYGGSPTGSGRWRPSSQAYGSSALDRVLGAYGGDASQVEVMTPSGPQSLDTTNKDQIDKLGSGEYKWRHKGDTGAGMTLGDLPSDMGSGFSTDHPDKSGRAGAETEGYGGTGSYNSSRGGGLKGQMQIGLSDEAKRLLTVMGPNPVPLTPNQEAANAGQGNAQANNPPPGDAPNTGRWRPRG
jgi:hypothetical protein